MSRSPMRMLRPGWYLLGWRYGLFVTFVVTSIWGAALVTSTTVEADATSSNISTDGRWPASKV